MPKHTNERGHHENVLGWRFDLAIQSGNFATSVEMMDAIAYAMNMAREYDEYIDQANELNDENIQLSKRVGELVAENKHLETRVKALLHTLEKDEPDACDWGGDE